MKQLQPGSIYVGQIIRRISKHSVSVWLLDAELGMSAYGNRVAAYRVGTVVHCRIASDCRHVDKIRPVSDRLKQEYAARRLLQVPLIDPEASGVYVGQVLDHMGSNAISIWLLDLTGCMIAFGVRSENYPPGTVVFCRVDKECEWIDKVLPAGDKTRSAYYEILPIK